MTEAAEDGILVIGEALVDIFSGPAGTEEAFGGGPANTALALGRLGHRVRLATAVGDDERGRGLREWLAASGVAVEATPIARTATARATLAADGSASYVFDLAWEASLASVRPAAVVHTGSIAAALEPGAAAVEGFLRSARATAIVSVDPNIRASLCDEGSRARIERILALADVIKLSDEDLAWLAPGSSPRNAAARWLSDGAELVVVTRGARGSLAFAHGGSVACDAVRVDVVDTVAAGDTFTAALLDGLVAEGLAGADRRDALRAIDTEALARLLSRASRAAAITVSRRGANPPTRAELGVEAGSER
ncbi:PfkB family carbohydrate kinase [Leifsonia sp. EB34]|uniref:PfkB family carbohydrate kinase n=1 Tax=Leifsonia sp. EB34 TaxID=3156303 RepID=UPI0035191616